MIYDDLNINKENIMKEIGYEMKKFGGNIIFSDLECSFTRIRNVSNLIQISYIDILLILELKKPNLMYKK